MLARLLFTLLLGLAPGIAASGSIDIGPVTVSGWKSVYGQVEARDRVAARTRIGGTVTDLNVSEGDRFLGTAHRPRHR